MWGGCVGKDWMRLLIYYSARQRQSIFYSTFHSLLGIVSEDLQFWSDETMSISPGRQFTSRGYRCLLLDVMAHPI